MSEQEQHKKRRGERLRPGPLRVQLESGQSGTLLDLSESGALLDLPAPEPVDSQISFELHCEGGPVKLEARVVRATPRYEGSWRVEWKEPASYHVGVELFDLAAQCATTLRALLRNASEGSS